MFDGVRAPGQVLDVSGTVVADDAGVDAAAQFSLSKPVCVCASRSSVTETRR